MESITEQEDIQIDSKRVQRGWAMFDWANSAFALVISAAVFPFYFSSQIDDNVEFMGMSFTDDALYSYSITFSYLILIIIIPLLSGMADSGGRRKYFMKMFTYIGAGASILLFFFQGHNALLLGLGGFALANIGFGGSLVFYNSYLPLITSQSKMDKVSALGFIMGYIGSVILLLFCLVLIQKGEAWGITNPTLPARISFLLVGIWWIAWSQIPFRRLPNDIRQKMNTGLVRKGLTELKLVAGQLTNMVNTKRFLISFLFFNAGVQTILYLAGTFAEKELDFQASQLIILILILQICAAIGAYLFAFVSKKIGNKLALMILVFLWMVCCFLAFKVTGKNFFYALALLVGLTMGGIQSLARATYGKLIRDRKNDITSFFSFYNVLQYVSTMFGTFLFGIMSQLTGSMRYSILSLGVLFLIGGILLSRVKMNFDETPEIRIA